MLDTLLSQANNTYGLGEVGRIHEIYSGTFCNCGQTPASCLPCKAILHSVESAGLTNALKTVFPKSLKEKSLISHLFSAKKCADYSRVSDTVFSSVAASTQSALLIDSSKNVSRAIALARASGTRILFLHFVRDGRGYVNSRNAPNRLKRLKKKPGFTRLIWKWAAKNLLVTLFLRPISKHFMTMRYEDFVKNPKVSIERIAQFVDHDLSAVINAIDDSDVISRRQIFESPREISYSNVVIEPSRLQSQRYSPFRNVAYLLAGGIIGVLWGYGLSQDYLE